MDKSHPVVISPGYQVGARHWVNHFMCSISFHLDSLPQSNAFPILYVSKTGVQFTELPEITWQIRVGWA